MKKSNILLFFLFTILIFAKTNLYIFYSYDCDHCQYLLKGSLQNELKNYDIDYHYYEVSNDKNLKTLFKLEAAIGKKGDDFPEIFIGNRMFAGAEIKSKALTKYIANNNEDINQKLKTILRNAYEYHTPVWTQFKNEVRINNTNNGQVKYMAYFYTASCSHCRKVDKMLDLFKKKYNLEIDYYDLPKNILLLNELEKRFKIPEKYKLGYPKIFIGNKIMLKNEITMKNIEKYIQNTKNSTPYWRNIKINKNEGKSILRRFKGFHLGTIIIAGLIDGINPCAFTTILFFISFLTLIHRKKKEILFTGIGFTLGIFISYVAIGLGLIVLIKDIMFLDIISKIIYLGMAALVLVFAFLSFYDYFKFKQKKYEEAKLQLPNYLKKITHKIIRKGKNVKNVALYAFFTGILISIVEFACTGQVYLPTITFVLKVPDMRFRALLFLIIYNIFFIIPLIIVFILAYFGFSSEKFNNIYTKMGPSVKIATGIFFIILAGFLIILSI